MEMDNSVIQQILSTQGQMLQQMNVMINQKNMPMMQNDALPMQSYSPPMEPQSGIMHSAPAAFAGSVLSNYYNYSPTRMSRAGQANYFADQNRAFQESAMGALNTGVNGAATVGSMFVGGGLMSSLAIGTGVGALVAGTTGLMMNGARQAMNYEDTLRTKGYMALNPFTSTSETGMIGFNRGETQDLAKFLRNVGPDEMLGDSDIQKILSGGLENRLMKNTTDMESFKKKFSSLVKSVKEITVTMDQSIEEATKFMGEMDRRGVLQSDMPKVAAQMKVTASMLGVSASAGSQMTMQVADSITQGTGINSGLVMQTTGTNMFMSSMLSNRAQAQDPALYQYIQNNGGAGQIGANIEQTLRQNITKNGTSTMLGLLASGFDKSGTGNEFVVNDARMNDLLSGKYTTQQLTAMSQDARNKLSPVEQNALLGQATELFQNSASSTQEYQVANLMKNMVQSTNPGMDDASAYKAVGITTDMQQGKILSQASKIALDPKMQLTMAAITAKERDDAAAIANTPSIGQRVRFGLETLGNTVGNVGQAASDSFSNAFWNLQQYTSGMDDHSRVAGNASYDLSTAGLNKTFGTDMQGVVDSAKKDTGSLNADQYQRMLSEGKKGNLDPSEVARLKNQLNDPKTSVFEKARIKNIITTTKGAPNLLTGENLFSGMDFGWNTMLSDVGSGLDWIKSKVDSSSPVDTMQFGDPKSSVANFAAQFATFQKDYTKEDSKLTDYLSGLGSSANLEAIQSAIQSGNQTAVDKLMGGKSSDATAAKLTADYNALHGREKVATTASDKFKSEMQTTEVFAKSVKGLENAFVGAHILDKNSAHQVFGSSSSLAEEALKKMKEQGFNEQDMTRYIGRMNASVLSNVKTMTPRELDDFANSLIKDSNSTIDKASLFVNGSNRFDPDKVTAAALSFAGASNNDAQSAVNTDGKKSAAKQTEAEIQLKTTMDGHLKSLGEMITAFEKEMALFRNTTAKLSIGTK
jgi:hypothetical protein